MGPYRKSRVRTVGALVVAGALLASAATTFAAGELQKPAAGQMQKAPSGPTMPGTAPAIKVEAQTLTVTVPPTGTVPTPTPTPNLNAGAQATVTFTFKNTGTGTVARVPWAIHLATSNETLAQGEKTGLKPGDVFTASASWTPTPGEKLLQGYVDPSGTTFKNTAATQVKELTVNVAGGAASHGKKVDKKKKDEKRPEEPR